MQHPGWLLIVVGLLIAGIGLVWPFSDFIDMPSRPST